MASKFTPSELDKLADLVKSYPVLWNVGEKDFKSNVKKELAWRKIGCVLGKPASDCKSRWRSTRDYYQKQRKGGKLAVKSRRSAYWSQLSFLDLEEETSNTSAKTSSEHAPEEIGEGSEICSEEYFMEMESKYNPNEVDLLVLESTNEGNNSIITTTQDISNLKLLHARKQEQDECKRVNKQISNRDYQTEGEDEIDLFFKTMAATVKKFRSDLKRKAKVKVFNIITDMEALNESE